MVDDALMATVMVYEEFSEGEHFECLLIEQVHMYLPCLDLLNLNGHGQDFIELVYLKLSLVYFGRFV
jgi:hypothetical protein